MPSDLRAINVVERTSSITSSSLGAARKSRAFDCAPSSLRFDDTVYVSAD